MSFNKTLRVNSLSVLTIFFLTAGFLLVPLTTSCSASVSQMTEEQAAESLRLLTRDGKLPPEATVLQIENRFSKHAPARLPNCCGRGFALKQTILTAPRKFKLDRFS
jgi:hypothetical protein